jgi:hypothetical protein
MEEGATKGLVPVQDVESSFSAPNTCLLECGLVVYTLGKAIENDDEQLRSSDMERIIKRLYYELQHHNPEVTIN